jgi:hypothetical protein
MVQPLLRRFTFRTLGHGTFLCGVLLTAPAIAAEVTQASAQAQTVVKPPEPAKPFYRGSSISYRNTMGALAMLPGAEPTYNPYYAMQLSFQPRAWLNDKVYARASFDIASELTRADWTNDSLFIGDLGLAVGADGLYKIPLVDVDVSGELSVGIPTSLASRATSRILQTSASLSLSRKFGKFSLSYSGGFDKNWNEYTTAAPTGTLLGVCGIGDRTGCVDMVVQTGRRNVDWALSSGLSGGYKATPWLSFSLGAGFSAAWLYALPEASQISLQVQQSTNVRYFLSSSASVTVKPSDLVTFSLGARSVHGQLAPDGSYRVPLINRFTQLYLDMGLNVASAIARFKS